MKKLSDGNVEVTFFYGNPRASEVLLAGELNPKRWTKKMTVSEVTSTTLEYPAVSMFTASSVALNASGFAFLNAINPL